jgi:hypothetical protein
VFLASRLEVCVSQNDRNKLVNIKVTRNVITSSNTVYISPVSNFIVGIDLDFVDNKLFVHERFPMVIESITIEIWESNKLSLSQAVRSRHSIREKQGK